MRSSNRSDPAAHARARRTTRTVTASIACARRLSAAPTTPRHRRAFRSYLRGEMMLSNSIRNPFRRWPAMLAAAAALTVCAAAQAFTPPPFPRIGGIQIGGPYDYNDPTYQAELAKQSVMILNYYPGLAPGGTSFDGDVKAIKALNPNALIFLYTNSDEENINSANSADASLINQINAMKWWLYTDTTFSTPVPSFFGDGGYTINNTPYTPKDSQGDDAIDYLTKWYVSNYYTPNPDIDGFFMDNVFT